MSDQLTEKQKAFIDYYVANGYNATQAAISAGYSQASAYQIGHENLKKPYIREAIDEVLQARQMTRDEILAKLTAVATCDIGELLTDDGEFDIARAKREGKTWMIRSITSKRRRRVDEKGNEYESEEKRVEIHDSMGALRSLMKPHGLDKQVIEVEEPGGALRELLKGLRAPWAHVEAQPEDGELDTEEDSG